MALTTEREPGNLRGTGSALRLLVLAVLSIALMVLDHRNEHLESVRRGLAVAVYPLTVAIDTPFAIQRWMDNNLGTMETLRSENETLRDELLRQNARIQRLTALEKENIRLRALLDSTATLGDRVLIAEILAVDMDPRRQSILVNKGGQDDVFVGQALIDASGVVGQVTRDRVFSAEALLITDADHAIPVEVARNRLRTIAVGTGETDRLSLPYLPRNADVREGDLLVTSGLGGRFPAGYPVGTVRNIAGDPGNAFLNIEATPAAALSRIREVLLIWPAAEPEDPATRLAESAVPAEADAESDSPETPVVAEPAADDTGNAEPDQVSSPAPEVAE